MGTGVSAEDNQGRMRIETSNGWKKKDSKRTI